MKTKLVAPLAMCCLLLAGCEGGDLQDHPKEAFGSLLGAGVGGLAGSQIGSGKGQLAAVAIGVLAGGLLGNSIGKSLDKADRAYLDQAAHNSLEYTPTGQTTSWRNPDSGHSGTITPTRTYQSSGQDCRDYSTNVTIDGKTETATGRACRQADGTWRIAS